MSPISPCHSPPPDIPSTSQSGHLITKWLTSGLGAILLMGAHWLHKLPAISSNTQDFWFVISVITFLVLLYSAGHYFRGAWLAFKNHQANMNTLIALGVGAAWIYSTIVILFPDSVPASARYAYFDSALFVVSFVSLGALLEARASHNTSLALTKLLSLQADTARVIENNQTIERPIDEVKVGDYIRVKPGEKIPLDGIVVADSANVDESMLTGEPMPHTKTEHDTVVGGTLVIHGSLLIKVTHTTKDSTLARIAKRVQTAQTSKLPIGRLADRIAAVFAPLVVILAIITCLAWIDFAPTYPLSTAIITAVSMLLIACPCALGVATPVSIALAIGKAAQLGLLIRDAKALQNAATIQILLVDKTGTLTEGKPDISRIFICEPWKPATLLQVAASVESLSEHPLAGPIMAEAAAHQLSLLPISDFQSIAGQGISATLDQEIVRIGNEALMTQHKIDLSAHYDDYQLALQEGSTCLWIAVDDQLAGLITVKDPIKDDSLQAISDLKALGIEPILLTGDQQATADAVAKQVGIETVVAGVLPEDKADQVKLWQSRGKRTGMAGDGVNDAAALAQADTGFAMGTGTDIAAESAGIILMHHSLMGLVDAIRLARKTTANIKQNLCAAFFYNILALPIAAGVFFPWTGWLLTPEIAGAAMALSSLSVVLNSNRLLFFTGHRKHTHASRD